MNRIFEGAATGILADDAVLTCGTCWWIFDPARGHLDSDIEPGTAFKALPDHWHCPRCDAPKAQFLVKFSGTEPATDPQKPANDEIAAPVTLQDRVSALVAAYHRADHEKQTQGPYNPAIAIAATGFQECTAPDGAAVGIITAPWGMSIVRLPALEEMTALERCGSARQHIFPSGIYRFASSHLPGFGLVETCPLFTAMGEFEDQAAAHLAAQTASAALFEPKPAQLSPGSTTPSSPRQAPANDQA